MANVLYNLKPGEGDQLIILLFRIYGTKFQYSTGQKINPAHWDKKKRRAKPGRAYPKSKELNYLLNNLEITTQNAYRKFINDNGENDVNFDDLKRSLKHALDKFLKKDISKAAPMDFFEFVEATIEERKRSPEFEGNTTKDYSKVLNRIKEFTQQSRRRTTFETIDLEWAIDFREWCFAPPRQYSTNYVHDIIKTIRTFLNEATERGLNRNMAFKSRRFQIPTEEVTHIYLSEEELDEVYQLDLSARLDKARDLFIVACFTGLRFSDLSQISVDNIVQLQGEDYLRVKTKKTGARVTVPIHAYVSAIFEKWGGPPPVISHQKFNSYIKELCLLTSWGNNTVIVTKSVGGKRVDQRIRKADLVVTHTGRRSFATNAFKSGVPVKMIMKITGHTTEKAFYKYIRIDDEESAVIVNQSDFFRRLRVV